ncbi:hypothetical protein HYALB_00005886 [Hymenoscyphus albidus]|uniref:Heterokaryon incompatibility domain-containing protein n=1 Tax=Hymenoscyphus albidus TaxID=595503 RepID=A0A9N9Q3G4_9HELO|nr:hypothetical protein HYALB_00005886 [Hymenoscyphus albidus]
MEPDVFSYRPLRDDRPQFRDDAQKFRLLRLPLDGKQYGDIHCELVEDFLDAGKSMPYIAVSYRWETGEKTSFIWIRHNGEDFECKVPVTSSVFSMIEALRGGDHRELWDDTGLFWIDTLCINQNDDKEKSHQVNHMKEVYTNASKVIVWLGKATAKSDFVMDALTAFQRRMPNPNVPPDDPNWDLAWYQVTSSSLYRSKTTDLRYSLLEVLSHSWFRRVWILQEIGNARSAYVLYGKKSISTKYFVMGTMLAGANPGRRCQAVLNLMPSPARKEVDSADLYSLLKEFSSTEATEPIDRIFALLGFYSQETGNGPLFPDYSKPISDNNLFSALKNLDIEILGHLAEHADDASIVKFLDKRTKYTEQHEKFVIKEKTLISIAKHTRLGRDLMQILIHVAGLDILKLIAPKSRKWLHIQGEIAMKLWATKQGQEIITLLYRRFRVHLQFQDESSMDQIKQDLDKRGVLMAILAQRLGFNIKLEDYESVLESAVSSGHIFIISNYHYSEIQNGYERPPPRAFVDYYNGNALSFERAILDRDIASVTTLTNVNNHTPLDSKNDIERLSSLRAVVAGDIDALSQLVESGADLEYQNEWGESLLALASRGGHTKVVEYLIKKGALLESRFTAGWTPLHLAAGQGHVDIVRVLLAHGTSSPYRSPNGWSPLHLATWQGHINIVSILLEHGANPIV